jgi:hypothetical protein
MSLYTEVREISREDYLQLQGLLTLATHHRLMLEDIARAACKITGEEPTSGGLTGDALFEGYTAEVLLGTLKIKVVE